MKLGMVGLGKMGANMTRRLIRGGHEVVVFDIDADSVASLADEGAAPSGSLEDLASQLASPRVVWVMVPSGEVTDSTLAQLKDLLDVGDLVIDGGNSRYTDSVRHGRELGEAGISFLDAGTSGGVWGLDNGYCLMVGGPRESFELAEPVLATLAPDQGYAPVGETGAGHFTKMVHNGIEYALMQAYGEGFELLHQSKFDIPIGEVAEVWRHGSVVRSWLLDLLAKALEDDPDLSDLDDYVDDSGEGRWTVETAIEYAIPTPTIAMSLFQRFASRQDASYAGKMISALRREFGGHAVRSIEDQGEK
jgi:6-phosphogluconate dehydrogenase